MKFFALVLAAWVSFAAPAFAFKADALKGQYQVLSGPQTDPTQTGYLIVDTNTLLSIWMKYGSGDLPSDLVPLKDHPAIIAGFTNRNLVILALEETSTVTPNYMKIEGDDTQLELVHQPNGSYQAAVVENGNLTNYTLGAPQPL